MWTLVNYLTFLSLLIFKIGIVIFKEMMLSINSKIHAKNLARYLLMLSIKVYSNYYFYHIHEAKKYALETKRHGRNDGLSFTQSYWVTSGWVESISPSDNTSLGIIQLAFPAFNSPVIQMWDGLGFFSSEGAGIFETDSLETVGVSFISWSYL